VLSFLKAPLLDLSISRSVTRARGWGIPVPGDASQIIYVWFDALANYLRDPARWNEASCVSHVIGKGITRFHAVYWPAILLSAGLRLPTRILVHGYVTIEGQKISKSLGNAISPDEACRRFGVDALRYYLLRHVGSHRDGDFSWSRFEEVYTHELADDLGNLLSRTTALGRKYGAPTATTAKLADGLAADVAAHVEAFALHRALDSIWRVIAETNAYINQTAPWTLARTGQPDALANVLGELYGTLERIGAALGPFLPDTATRLRDALAASAPTQLFPKPATSARLSVSSTLASGGRSGKSVVPSAGR
jgi:methionyl-tRNA synthetase